MNRLINLSTTNLLLSIKRKVLPNQSNIISELSYFKNKSLNNSAIVCKNYSTLNSSSSSTPIRNFELNTTKLVKDVIIFKYENPKFFKILNIFAICQFFFWTYLAHFSYTTLRDAPPTIDEKSDPSWFRKINLGENKYRNGITIFCAIIGYGILASAWMFTLRSVRYLILRKGGEKVSFVTYTPFGHNRIMDVPINCVSAQESRHAAKTTLPIKVKNKAFYYLLDMRGEFLNIKLYDYNVGLKRKL